MTCDLNKMAGPERERPFLFSPDGEVECLAEIAENAEMARLTARSGSHRNHGKHRNAALGCFAALGVHGWRRLHR